MLDKDKENSTPTQSGVSISIIKIEELSFRTSIPDKFKESFDVAALRIGFAYGLNPMPEADKFNVSVSVRYEYNEQEILEYHAMVAFNVDNLSSFIEINKKQLKVNPDFVPVLLNTAIGALRGMLALKTTSTVLSDHPLPLMDLGELLKNEYVLEG